MRDATVLLKREENFSKKVVSKKCAITVKSIKGVTVVMQEKKKPCAHPQGFYSLIFRFVNAK